MVKYQQDKNLSTSRVAPCTGKPLEGLVFVTLISVRGSNIKCLVLTLNQLGVGHVSLYGSMDLW